MHIMHKQIQGLAFWIALFTVSAAAQTNTFPTSGNVGIGTTTPAALLDVNGVIDVTGAHAIIGSSSTHNWFIGEAGNTTSTGTWNIALGTNALQANTAGQWNVALGQDALYSNTTGEWNIAIGQYALYNNTTGVQNIAIGNGALQSDTATWNIAIGGGALGANTTSPYNTAIGMYALANMTTAGFSTAIGLQALQNSNAGFNVAVGQQSLYSATTGADNTSLGHFTLGNITTGWGDVGVGYEAGTYISGGTANQTSSLGTYIGLQAEAYANGDTNETVIGSYAVGNGSNTTTIGNSSVVSTIIPAGKVGIGTTSPGATLEVNGTVQVDTSLAVGTGGITFTGQSGTQTTPWTGVLCGGDYAEAVDVADDRKQYQPGDVLVLSSGDGGDVEKSIEPYSTMVAGIFATKPGAIGRRQTMPTSSDEIPMAMVGIVPTKVSAENGPIRRGDLLVTSSLKGYAMKGTDRSRMLGAVIGKAMGSLESGTGVIEVLVTLQ